MIPLILGFSESFAFIVLYVVIGFGPGLTLGIIVGNLLGGHGQEHLHIKQTRAIKAATEHNAQWHPTHKRWQQK